VKNDYQIQELVAQSANMVVYLVTDKEGQRHALTRLVLSEKRLENFLSEQFEAAFAQLKTLEHPCLRGVMDGGLDEVDNQPWVVSQWWEGENLEDRLADQQFGDPELNRLHGLAQVLIEKIAPFAGAIAFQPNLIINTKAADGSSIETFTMDFFLWFDDWAAGVSPGSSVDPNRKLANLVTLIQGPPISRPIFPTVIEPPAVTRLASAKSTGSTGTVLLVAGILLTLGLGGFAFLKNRKPKEPEVTSIEESEKKKAPKAASGARPRKIEASIPSRPVESSKQTSKLKGRPEMPDMEWLEENHQLSAKDEGRRKELAGKWVNVRGWVEAVSGEGEWTFEIDGSDGVPLKARLEGRSTLKVEGKAVGVIGFLVNRDLLVIPKLWGDDVLADDELLEERNPFTVQDAARIEEMEGRTIRLTGKVVELEEGSTSIFLHFIKVDGENAILAGKISKKKFTKTHDAEFFEGLVGKNITLAGVVTKSLSRKGKYILFERNKDLKLAGELPAGAIAKKSSEPAKPKNERPSLGEMNEVKAEDESAREENEGRWVILEGQVEKVSDEGELHFVVDEGGEPLKAELKEGEIEDVAGRMVTAVGMLKNSGLLVIEKASDVEVGELVVAPDKGKEFTVDDQIKIRSSEGEVITVRGKVLSASASSSGKTLYLNFTDKRPILALGVKVKDAEAGLNLEFLKEFVGDEIVVTGLAIEEFGGQRFIISITKKDQMEK
jgi:hypothetical protein